MIKTSAERDMEKYLNEHIQKLFVDFKWRCEALDIEQETWLAMLVSTMLTYAIVTSGVMMPKDSKKRASAEEQFKAMIAYRVDRELRKIRDVERTL